MLDWETLQTTTNPGLITVMYTIMVAFLLSTLIGVTYIKTFRALSWSRNYVQSLILSSIVAATVMQAIGDSLARGLGMLGALAIIRFRTNFKDPRDILFMFSALAAGIACGVGGYTIAVIGTTGFIIVAIILMYSPLGQSNTFDGLLRFNVEADHEGEISLEKLLRTYCSKFALITLRELQQGSRLDYAYQIKLKRKVERTTLVRNLQEHIPTIKGIQLLLQETTLEL